VRSARSLNRPRTRCARACALAFLVVGATGCNRVEQWLSKKADEKIASELDTAADSLDDDDPSANVKSSGKGSKKRKKPAATASASSSSPAGPTQDLTPVAPLNYVEDMASAVSLFKEAVPGARYTEILLYPSYGTATLEDPKAKGTLVEYELRNGRVHKGKPPLIPPHDINAALFDIDAINFGLMKAMAKDAPIRCGMPTKPASYVVLEREIPFSTDIIFRIYVDEGNKNAEYDDKGKFIQSQ